MVDTLRWSRLLRRATLPVALVLGILLYRNYGWLRVPAGMDTVPALPAGSLCLIDKRPGIPVAGAVVFVDVEAAAGGGSLLGRVVSVDAAGIHLAADEPASRFAELLAQRPFPATALRGLVLTSFGTPQEEHGGR